MKIKIESSKLTDAPYSKATENAFVFEEDGALQQLKLELENAEPGSYLISGYRGSGKTSFINRVKAAVTGFMIVDLNIPQQEKYPVLIKKIIRQLYLTYTNYRPTVESEKNQEFEDEFKLLYDRTFNDIVHSKLSSLKQEEKSELKLQYDYKKFIPYLLVILSATGITFVMSAKWEQYLLLIGAAVWACVADFSQTWTRTRTGTQSAELSRKSLYDDEIAEYHLFAIMQKLKNNGVKILIAFDELDKLQDDDDIKAVINDLKPLLLSGYGSFIVVAGQSLFYELEKSTYLDDLVITTLFSKSVHVPFLKNAALKKYCLSLISDDADKSNPLVNDFFDSLILQSGRIPRKLVNLIRSAITWDDKQATIIIDENRTDTLKWKSKILQAVTYAIDNDLAGQARNTVQRDFCTAQSFIWLGKMLQFTSIPFQRDDIFKLDDYDKRYPDTYKKVLYEVWNSLVDQLSTDKLLKVTDGIDPEAGNDTYGWIVLNENATSAIIVDTPGISDALANPPTDDEGINNTSAKNIDPDEQIKQSLFLTDFAELEAYTRQLYLELEPNSTSSNISFINLIEKLSDMGVLAKGWSTSPRVKKLNETRDKISTGQAIGANDLDEVRSSTRNMGRLRSEINEAYTYFVAKKFLLNYKVEKSTKGGFDFMAIGDYFQIAFEVKSSQNGKLDMGLVSEIIDKYSNYTVINKQPLQYVIFYFQPPGRKSMDDFYMNFNSTLAASFPDYQKYIHLFYLTTAYDQNSIREQIENGIGKVSNEINAQQME